MVPASTITRFAAGERRAGQEQGASRMNEHPADVARTDILGVRVCELTIPRALDIIAASIETRAKSRFVFCTVHTITECQRDPRLMEAVNNSIVAPDGMPLVWLCRRSGRKDIRRVYGPDTLLATCQAGVVARYRHFFYGSTDETLAALVRRLSTRYPGIVVAGTYVPPFRTLSPGEDAEIVEQINAAAPDIVWVGLGMPKQELWIAAHQGRLTAPVLMAVGAAFDFHAGIVRQAPPWIQRSGLEWLFRLTQEPRRLWRRYLIGNTRFLWLLAQSKLGGSRPTRSA
jgi:N-acetylglucosaminyldiphosphoundecaprenol N-acetyl-beta-D-mannosaminyltransferase